MVPREARRGQSFKGAGLYYLHDKDALTSERVEFTHTENVPTNDPEKAIRWMTWTAMHADGLKRESGAKNTGRPCSRPVFSFSLAWHPEEKPEKWQMIAAARQALAVLGLTEHETLMVAHNDEAHAHLHAIVNIIHPQTGKASSLSHSRLKLSKWAERYEKEHGKIYCQQRVENNERRAKGEKVKYKEPEINLRAEVTKLYLASHSGKAFQTALQEKCYRLAQGKRIVLIDREGKIHSLSRQIEGVKAKAIRDKLRYLDLLPVEEARGKDGKEKEQSKSQPKEEAVYFDRDRQDQGWQESIIDAGIKADQERKLQKTRKDRRSGKAPSPAPPPKKRDINKIQDRQLQDLGDFYTRSHAARVQLNERLDRQYGADARRLRREIEKLETMLKNSSRTKLWWLQMAGEIPRDPEDELEAMRKSLANIEWRQEEARSSLETQIKAETETIQIRQEQERQSPALDPVRSEIAAEFNRAAEGQNQNITITRDNGPTLSRE